MDGINPAFEKRLLNWARCNRSSHVRSLASPMAQVLDQLRYSYGAADEGGSGSKAVALDHQDAAKLDAAYRGPWMTLAEKRVLRLKYGEWKSDRQIARMLTVSYRSFQREFVLLVRKFQMIVETRFDNPEPPGYNLSYNC